MSATARRVVYALRSGEAFGARFVGYETPAWPLTEIEYQQLAPGVVVVFQCDFPSLSGVSVRVRASRRTRIELTVADAAGTIVRRCSMAGRWIPEEGMTHFRFRPVRSSSGQDLTILLSCSGPGTASVAVSQLREVGPLRSDTAQIPQSLFYSSDKSLTQYDLWIRRNEPSGAALAELREYDVPGGPVVSVVVPVYKTPLKALNAMVASVVDQTWPRWELCIADAGSADEDVGQVLDRWAAKDQRIHVVHLGENRGIAGNTNAALALAAGTYVALLDHDDTLAPFALSSIARAVVGYGQPDMLYSDEDKLDHASGRRMDPVFKPDWSPHLALGVNYVAHLLCVRKGLLDTVGGLRPGFDGSQDYDLILRCSEQAHQIVHVPQVLYHWRMSPSSTAGNTVAKCYAYEAGRRALTEHLAKVGLEGEVICRPVLGHYKVCLDLPKDLAVSVIIPSHDNPRMLAEAVKSSLGATPSVREVLVLENGSRQPETLALYREIGQIDRVRVLDYGKRPFNYSLINNWGAAQARGDALLLLNDDVRALSRDWLEAMAQWLIDPEVGAVGARLIYPDGYVQHNGVVLGMGGLAGHRSQGGSDQQEVALDKMSGDVRDVSAATAACLLVRRSAFQEVGGFDETFPLAYGDVDLCMRLHNHGYRIVCTPDAKLVHCESATRGSDLSPDRLPVFLAATREMRSRWGPELDADPFYNPNLTLNESLPRMRMT